MEHRVHLYASLLNADLAQLGDQVADLETSGVIAGLHVDVMDGHFVPNLAFGPQVVEALRERTGLPMEVHLMVDEPGRYLAAFHRAGASTLIVHAEACRHLHREVWAIRTLGCAAGVALNPATPLLALEHVLEDLDQVLLMGVNPGFGGQAFIPAVHQKIGACRRLLARCGSGAMISLDGGVKPENVTALAAGGARQLVLGSALFGPAGVLASCQAAAAPLQRVRALGPNGRSRAA